MPDAGQKAYSPPATQVLLCSWCLGNGRFDDGRIRPAVTIYQGDALCTDHYRFRMAVE